MNNPNALIFLGIGALVVVGLGYAFISGGLRQWRKFKLLTATPTTPASRVRPGVVEVQGKAVTDMDLLRSPMSNTRCLYYRFKVVETRTERRGGKTRTKKVTIINDVQSLRCFVEDSSGRVRVALESAELDLKTDQRTASGFLNEAPEQLKTLLQNRYGESTQGLIFNKAMSYEETYVMPGDKLYVLGTAAREGDGHVVTSSGNKDVPFLVSDRPEAELGASLKRSAIGQFVGAALVVVLPIAGALFFVVAR